MSYQIDEEWLEFLNLRRAKQEPSGYEIVIPERCNIAYNTVERNAIEQPDNLALIFEDEGLSVRTWTFAELERDSSRLAHSLSELGVKRGDRVALHTGMRPETGIAHMALHKLGAVAVTLSQLYGPDTLMHIINHAEVTTIISQDKAWARFRDRVEEFETLENCIVIGEVVDSEINFSDLITNGPNSVKSVDTAADEMALLMYTSGSTGLPKGIMHGHRILEAYVPSLSLVFDLDRNDPS